MRVAVLSLTRDRLLYTKHCFGALHRKAGCLFNHYVLDNGSTDGTPDWLEEYDPFEHVFLEENIGIAGGMNRLLDLIDPSDYDAIVHFDNDCELTQPDTLKKLCELVVEGDAILSPRILGLNNPPAHTREVRIGDEVILDIPQIGGIMLTAPAWVYDEFRYPKDLPVWGHDDAYLCAWFRASGGTCGYVKSLEAWHYRSTAGQHEDMQWYFDRRVSEGAPA